MGTYKLEIKYTQSKEYIEPVPGTTLVTVSEGAEMTDLNFSFKRGGIIKGSIRDLITGSPLSGLVVKAERLVPAGYNRGVSISWGRGI